MFVFCFEFPAAVLKDVPNSPHQMIKDPSQDHIRMSAYPNLEYGNLYNAIAMLLDVAPNIQFGLNGKNKRPFTRQFLTKITILSIFHSSVWQSGTAVFGLYFTVSR